MMKTFVLVMGLVFLPMWAIAADVVSDENALFAQAEAALESHSYEQALALYKQSAELGHPEAQKLIVEMEDIMAANAAVPISPMLLNFLYAIFGGFLTLFFMWLGCRIFNHSAGFDINDELSRGNVAVGLMIMGIFIGIGTALGLVIGLGLS